MFTVKTEDGKKYDATPAKRKAGTKGKTTQSKSSNIWLHPAQLKLILKYARDVYLENQSKETVNKLKSILQIYLDALNTAQPKIDVWTESGKETWVKSRGVFSSFITRMEGQKDYFNNPAGHMPLLTLSNSISLNCS